MTKQITRLTDERLAEIKRWLCDETSVDPNVGQDELASIATEAERLRKALQNISHSVRAPEFADSMEVREMAERALAGSPVEPDGKS